MVLIPLLKMSLVNRASSSFTQEGFSTMLTSSSTKMNFSKPDCKLYL